jgi:quinol monooxygenase YgiN
MSIAFSAALFGAPAAAVAAVVSLAQAVRMQRADLAAWAIATMSLMLALIAQVFGFRSGFSALTFRTTQIGAQLIAPLAMAWGITEVLAPRMPIRLLARGALPSVALVGAVIVGTRPVGPPKPAGAARVAQSIPNVALLVIAGIAICAAVAGVLAAGSRTHADPAWRRGLATVAVAGGAVVAAAGGAVVITHASALSLRGFPAYPLLCVLAAGLATAASLIGGRFRANAMSAIPDASWKGTAYAAMPGTDLYRYPETANGKFSAVPDGSSRAPSSGDDDEPQVTLASEADPGISEYFRDGGDAETDPEGYYLGLAVASLAATTSGPTPSPDPARPSRQDDKDLDQEGDLAGLGPWRLSRLKSGDVAEAGQPYGRMTVYSLLDQGAAEFDRIADEVAEKVRAREPDTLIYIVHEVPSMPLHRILYTVFRNRSAYDEHIRQPHVQELASAVQRLALSANVIELGLR